MPFTLEEIAAARERRRAKLAMYPNGETRTIVPGEVKLMPENPQIQAPPVAQPKAPAPAITEEPPVPRATVQDLIGRTPGFLKQLPSQIKPSFERGVAAAEGQVKPMQEGLRPAEAYAGVMSSIPGGIEKAARLGLSYLPGLAKRAVYGIGNIPIPGTKKKPEEM